MATSSPKLGISILTSLQFETLPKNLQGLRRLNQTQMRCIVEMMDQTPSINLSLKTEEARLFEEPFQVVFGQGEYELSEEMKEEHIREFWMPWLPQMNWWLNAFGIVPFYIQNVTKYYHEATTATTTTTAAQHSSHESTDKMMEESGGSDMEEEEDEDTAPLISKEVRFQYPVTPSFDMGEVYTFVYERTQHLLWKWNTQLQKPQGDFGVPLQGSDNFDTNMFFLVENMPRLKTGNCISRLSPLLAEWLEIQQCIRNASVVRTRNQTREHIIEYHPHIAGAGGSGSDVNFREAQQQSSLYPTYQLGGGGGSGGSGSSADSPIASHVHTYLSTLDSHQMSMYASSATNDRLVGLDLDSEAIDSSNPSATPSAAARYLHSQVLAQEELQRFLQQNPAVSQYVDVQVGSDLPGAHKLRPFERHIAVAPLPLQETPESILAMKAQFDRKVGAVLENVSLGSVAELGNSSRSKKYSSSALGVGSSGLPNGQFDQRREHQHQSLHIRMRYYSTLIKEVFKLAYQESLEEFWTDTKRLMQLNMQLIPPQQHAKLERIMSSVEVVFQCKNLDLSAEEVLQYYGLGVIDDSEAWHSLRSKVSFITPPDHAPPEFVDRIKALYRAAILTDTTEPSKGKKRKSATSQEKERDTDEPKPKKQKKTPPSEDDG